jgi:hypothetical protein
LQYPEHSIRHKAATLCLQLLKEARVHACSLMMMMSLTFFYCPTPPHPPLHCQSTHSIQYIYIYALKASHHRAYLYTTIQEHHENPVHTASILLMNLLPIFVGDDKDMAGSSSKMKKRTMAQCQKWAVQMIDDVARIPCQQQLATAATTTARPVQAAAEEEVGGASEHGGHHGHGGGAAHPVNPVPARSLIVQSKPLASVVMLFLRQVCLRSPSKAEERATAIANLLHIYSNASITPEHRADFISFLHKYCRNVKINFRTFGVDTASVLFKWEGQHIDQGM